MQHCTQNVLINPQTSGIVTTTTATSGSLALQGQCCGHTPGCVTITVMHSACTCGQFDLCTLQRVFYTHQYRVRHSLSLLLYTLASSLRAKIRSALAVRMKRNSSRKPFLAYITEQPLYRTQQSLAHSRSTKYKLTLKDSHNY